MFNLSKNFVEYINENKIKVLSYVYSKDNEVTNKSIWRCIDRKCSGRVYIYESDENLEFIGKHSCEKPKIFLRKNLLRKRIINYAINTIYSTAQIYEMLCKEFPADDILLFNKKSIYMTIYNQRKVSGVLNNGQLSDIPDELKLTLKGQNFIFYDSGVQDSQRIIIFGTEENATHARHSTVLLADGTFKVSPSEFYQVYIIYYQLFGKILPAFYCLLPSKSETTYSRLFEQLKIIMEDNHPDYFIVDHENAVIKTFKEQFPTTKIRLCLFHFGQTIFRKIAELGLSTEYMNNENSRLHMKMLMSLAFVPEDQVQVVFRILKGKMLALNNPKIDDLLLYFEKNYIEFSNEYFNINSWNAFERLLEKVPLTTNNLESFNNYLKEKCSKSHPSMLSLIITLRTIQNEIEIKLCEIIICPEREYGTIKYQEKLCQIREIALRYSSYYDIYYIKAISLTYNWYFH